MRAKRPKKNEREKKDVNSVNTHTREKKVIFFFNRKIVTREEEKVLDRHDRVPRTVNKLCVNLFKDG